MHRLPSPTSSADKDETTRPETSPVSESLAFLGLRRRPNNGQHCRVSEPIGVVAGQIEYAGYATQVVVAEFARIQAWQIR